MSDATSVARPAGDAPRSEETTIWSHFPVWTRNGEELIYTVFLPADSTGQSPQRVMSVQVGPGPEFSTPHELFTRRSGAALPFARSTSRRTGRAP